MLDPDLTASSEGPTPCESELGHAVHAEMKCADSVRLQYAEIDTILPSVRVRVSSRLPAAVIQLNQSQSRNREAERFTAAKQLI